MDLLHRPDEYPFISDVVDVRGFFESALRLQDGIVNGGPHEMPMGPDVSVKELFVNRTGCEEDVFNELEKLCDPEKLRCDKDENVEEEDEDPLSGKIPEEGLKSLVTLEIQNRELQRRKEQLSYRQMACQLHKYKRMNFTILDRYRDANETEGKHVAYMAPDVLLTAFLAKPYNRVLEYHEIRLGRLLSMDTSFYVLGNTSLTALRDKISCLCDYSTMHDTSTDPDLRPGLAKDVYKSGYFYINGTFYNDKRYGCFELTPQILEWAQRRTDEVGPFQTASMEDTKFIDLKLRLGQPYVYVHQGSCEHLMIFGDLRLLSSSECQNPSEYPMLVSLKPKKRVPCCSCKMYTAKWVAYGNEELPFDPSFFCDPCYRLFNYDKDGNKIGEFQATRYYDRSTLP